MSTLEVQGLVKRFAGQSVLDHISFHVEDGEFFVLLGPSGGGKTTILRIICGLEQPDEGHVLLGGEEITHLSPRQRNVGMVFQDYGLYPSMDVYGNIAYGLENRHLPREEIRRRVLEAAEKLQLTPLLTRSIATLSGGEQQRVALARILAREASVFLYDEPLANLDPRLRHQARRDILAVHRLRGVPSLYVTHEQSEAFAIADRIGVLAGGRLQQVGRPAELLEQPANLFMARFIGNPPMNLLPVRLESVDAEYVCSWAGLRLPLPAHWRPVLQRLPPGDPPPAATVIMGIRPRDLLPPWELQSAATEGTLCRWQARVTSLEPLIGELLVYLQLLPPATAASTPQDEEQATTLAAVWPEPESSQDLPEIGTVLPVGLNPASCYLFDPHSEQALKAECV